MKKVVVKYLNSQGHETRQMLAAEFYQEYPADRVVIVDQTPVNSPEEFLAQVEHNAQQEIPVYVFPTLMGG